MVRCGPFARQGFCGSRFVIQAIATPIAVYGLLMTPLGWKLAGLVWGYAVIWFLLTDRVKLLGYRFLDHAKAGEYEA